VSGNGADIVVLRPHAPALSCIRRLARAQGAHSILLLRKDRIG